MTKLIKAKTKADKAAARAAAQAPLIAAMLIPAPPSAPAPSSAPSPAPEEHASEGSVSAAAAAAATDRTELLRSKPAVVGRFMQLTVPILIDVYAASVNTPVRVKTLTGLLKAASFLDADGLKQVLTVCVSRMLLTD